VGEFLRGCASAFQEVGVVGLTPAKQGIGADLTTFYEECAIDVRGLLYLACFLFCVREEVRAYRKHNLYQYTH
jgi:hypothetical protein